MIVVRQAGWAGRTVALDLHPAVVEAARRAGDALTLRLRLVFG